MARLEMAANVVYRSEAFAEDLVDENPSGAGAGARAEEAAEHARGLPRWAPGLLVVVALASNALLTLWLPAA